MNKIDHEQERKKEIDRVLNSSHPRRIVVGGPGTGKSYLFEQAVKRKIRDGGQDFLAITFMGKLRDELADHLAGLAKTTTLHSFARDLVLGACPDWWEYYPGISEIIKEDLRIKGLEEIEVGDENYEEKTKYYKAVGHNDVIHYAVKICKKDESKIPEHDLILVDEFQDFTEIEAEFVDLLSHKNEILITGDDDQALYTFRGSTPKFLRRKFDPDNSRFEEHTLRFCSRCTKVIIKAFDNVIKAVEKKGGMENRIEKKLIHYKPDKAEDSQLNPKIMVYESVYPGQIASKIKKELEEVLTRQKIKSVLVLGEAQSCCSVLSRIARQLTEFGFKHMNHDDIHKEMFSFKPHIIAAYKVLYAGSNKLFAWRLLINEMAENKKKQLIKEYYDDKEGFISAIPDDFEDKHKKAAKTLKKILSKPKSKRDRIANSTILQLRDRIVDEKIKQERQERDFLIEKLIHDNKHLPKPLADLDITVSNILKAKGLGADVVFLIGFDQGKLPVKKVATEGEIYQLLVALTRTRKRMYLFSTKGQQVSQFLNYIGNELCEKID